MTQKPTGVSHPEKPSYMLTKVLTAASLCEKEKAGSKPDTHKIYKLEYYTVVFPQQKKVVTGCIWINPDGSWR